MFFFVELSRILCPSFAHSFFSLAITNSPTQDKFVQFDKKRVPFAVVSKHGVPNFEVSTGSAEKVYFSPTEISAMVLGKIKETAELHLGANVSSAVITVPAYFNDAQRQATKDAGRAAGLDVERIINEPTAAAIGYGLDKKSGERNILVYDLGGSTFDVTVLSIDDGVFEIVATNGDMHLGGGDFDQRIIMHFVDMIKERYKKDMSKDKKAITKLRKGAERAKIALSQSHTTRLEIDALFDGEDFSEELTRTTFEELNNDFFERTMGLVADAIKEANFSKADIDEVVLVGGSSHIPMIHKLLKDFFDGKEPLHDSAPQGVHADEAVAHGAAIQAFILQGDMEMRTHCLLDVVELSLGVETAGGVFARVINCNTVIPTRHSRTLAIPRGRIRVFMGERAMVRDNILIGEFNLTESTENPRRGDGTIEAEVTVEIDANGIIDVSATEKVSGRTESITIKNLKGTISSEEIERLSCEAEEAAEEDKKVKERAEAKVGLASYCHFLLNQLGDNKVRDEVSNEDRTSLEKVIEDTFEWLEEHGEADFDQVESKLEEVRGIFAPIVPEGNWEDANREERGGERLGEDEDEKSEL